MLTIILEALKRFVENNPATALMDRHEPNPCALFLSSRGASSMLTSHKSRRRILPGQEVAFTGKRCFFVCALPTLDKPAAILITHHIPYDPVSRLTLWSICKAHPSFPLRGTVLAIPASWLLGTSSIELQNHGAACELSAVKSRS